MLLVMLHISVGTGGDGGPCRLVAFPWSKLLSPTQVSLQGVRWDQWGVCTMGAPSQGDKTLSELPVSSRGHWVTSCLSMCSVVGMWQGPGWDPHGDSVCFRPQTLHTNSVMCNHTSKLCCSWKRVLVQAFMFVLRDSLQCILHEDFQLNNVDKYCWNWFRGRISWAVNSEKGALCLEPWGIKLNQSNPSGPQHMNEITEIAKQYFSM